MLNPRNQADLARGLATTGELLQEVRRSVSAGTGVLAFVTSMASRRQLSLSVTAADPLSATKDADREPMVRACDPESLGSSLVLKTRKLHLLRHRRMTRRPPGHKQKTISRLSGSRQQF
jgi:hypothetical protein